jgi:signal transduction histidine kinase/class 3 adenylate cyclase
VPEGSNDRLAEELAHYKRRVDELAGENLKYDYAISGLRHELKQRKQGFALLAELQQSIGAHKEISSIFEIVVSNINSTLGMDSTIVLTPTEEENVYRPSQWFASREQTDEHLSALEIEFPPEFATGSGLLVVNGSTEATPLIETIREELALPYFICVPVMAAQAPIGLIVSGRLLEVPPFYPPLDRGDADTLQAIAGLVSASVQNMRIAVLQETDRLKTEFFSNISHEFRTPIALTFGPLKQLLAGRYGVLSDVVRGQLDVMLRNQQRLLELINQILDLEKLEAGEMQLRCEPMRDMNRFVEQRAAQFRALAQARSVELRLQLDPRVEGAELFVDREKFDRMLANLLANAVKFTKEGSIEVATEINGTAFRISVKDTGIGIEQDELPHVFHRFRQADSGAAREYAGTGIGLALVKDFANLHGGDVCVHSDYGRGSTFRVSIPLGKEHLSPASLIDVGEEQLAELDGGAAVLIVEEGEADHERVDALNRDAEAAFEPEKPIVLYAEDNRDLRHHVRELLADEYNVLLAVDGRQAIELARQKRPDLVLADQMMPHMSGHGLLRELRADPELRAVPVVFLTARVGTEARIESFDAGADDYLSKPFDEAELRARIRNLVRARQQERELADLKLARLKRFFSPQLAELILAGGADDPLRSHRRKLTVAFVDLRGFTAFSETAEPEDVMEVLREYHAALGKLVLAYGGTIERFLGDGFMAFFNDPVPVDDAAERAIRMSLAIRERATELTVKWRKHEYDLSFGVGLAEGYATIGTIGFEERLDYGAIGAVVNLAARLCAEAKPGQILIPQRVLAAVEGRVNVEPVGELPLKGFHRPITAYNLLSLEQ